MHRLGNSCTSCSSNLQLELRCILECTLYYYTGISLLPLIITTRPGGARSQALHGLGCDRRQSTLPVRLGWRGMPGASWLRVGSKPIDLAHSTRVARDPYRFMDLGAIEGNRTCPFDLGSTRCQALLQCIACRSI